MLNNVCIQGRLIHDPNYRETAKGGSYCSIVLAIERPKSSGPDRVSDIIPCVAWGKTAEYISNYFSKDDMVVVGGHLQSREYVNKEGVKSTAYEVLIKECNAVDGKKRVEPKGVNDNYIDWDSIPKIKREY